MTDISMEAEATQQSLQKSLEEHNFKEHVEVRMPFRERCKRKCCSYALWSKPAVCMSADVS